MEVQLAAVLDPVILERLKAVYPGLSAAVEGDRTVLFWMDSGSQKEFLHLLDRLDSEGLTILHAGQRAATLEEAFVHLTSEQAEAHK